MMLLGFWVSKLGWAGLMRDGMHAGVTLKARVARGEKVQQCSIEGPQPPVRF